MKKRIIRALNTALVLALLIGYQVQASSIELPQSNPFEEPTMMRVTCYTDAGTTATGCQTREGICAGNPEWYGCVASIWAIDESGAEYWMGYYEILDTGAGFDTDGDGYGDSLKNGTSLDVWVASDAEAQEWQSHGEYFLVKITKGVG